MVELFAKTINNFKLLTFFFAKKPHHKCLTVLPVKKTETNCLTLFYILLHNSSPALVDIKQTLHYKVAIE